jgi:hypothetical protein
MHPKDKGLFSHETAYASGLWYLHSHPTLRGATARQEDRVRNDSNEEGMKDSNVKRHLVHIYIQMF